MIKKGFLPLLATVAAAILLALPFFHWNQLAYPGAGIWRNGLAVHGVVVECLVALAVIGLLRSAGCLGRFVAWFLALAVPLALGVQYLHLYFGGSLLGPATLQHADQWGLVTDTATLRQALVVPLGWLVMGFWWRLTRNQGRWQAPLVALILALMIALVAHHRLPVERLDVHRPLTRLAVTLVDYFGGGEVTQPAGPIDPELARRFGFEPLAAGDGWPWRTRIYDTPMPWPRRVGAPTRRPNVIVFFVESLSARMVGAYGLRSYSVTPHLDRFAKRAMRVTGYVNHTTPTVPGLFGQLCSIYPPWVAEMTGVQAQGPWRCLPRLMAEQGYYTAYLTHSSPKYAHIGELTKAWGFQDRFFVRRLQTQYLGGEAPVLGLGGLSDHQVMRALVGYLSRSDVRPAGKPFFLAVSTVGTHTGRTLNPVDGVPPLPGHTATVDALFHDFDDAFGRFLDWFERSPLAANTILVVTGDHAHFPGLPFRAVAGEGYQPSVWDDLALLIRDPFHQLPRVLQVRASSLDLAPTLWQLAGLPARRRNPFLGRSIFGDRQKTLGSLSMSAYQELRYLVQDPAGRRWRRQGECAGGGDLRCRRDAALAGLVRRYQRLLLHDLAGSLGGKVVESPKKSLQPARR